MRCLGDPGAALFTKGEGGSVQIRGLIVDDDYPSVPTDSVSHSDWVRSVMTKVALPAGSPTPEN